MKPKPDVPGAFHERPETKDCGLRILSCGKRDGNTADAGVK